MLIIEKSFLPHLLLNWRSSGLDLGSEFHPFFFFCLETCAPRRGGTFDSMLHSFLPKSQWYWASQDLQNDTEIVKDMYKHIGESSIKRLEPWTQARLKRTLSIVPTGKDIILRTV